MNQSTEDIKADPALVQILTMKLLESLDEYTRENKFRNIDVFMSVHSFHKATVKGLATFWETQGIPADKTYRMADMTFRNAMRELRRSLPNLQKGSFNTNRVQLNSDSDLLSSPSLGTIPEKEVDILSGHLEPTS